MKIYINGEIECDGIEEITIGNKIWDGKTILEIKNIKVINDTEVELEFTDIFKDKLIAKEMLEFIMKLENKNYACIDLIDLDTNVFKGIIGCATLGMNNLSNKGKEFIKNIIDK